MLSSTKGIKCKKCGDRFLPYHNNSMQKFCMKKDECITAHKELVTTARNTAEANFRANVGSKKELRERLKKWSDYYNETLEVFNEYIRLRDKDKPCISCNAPAGTYTMSSGHFHPQGQYRGIAMHEDNSHGQCWYNCNKNKHGNLTEYRPRLIERIGPERVEEIDRLRNTTIKPTIAELIELKVTYKDKTKKLKG